LVWYSSCSIGQLVGGAAISGDDAGVPLCAAIDAMPSPRCNRGGQLKEPGGEIDAESQNCRPRRVACLPGWDALVWDG
jgi:hypothetical protein